MQVLVYFSVAKTAYHTYGVLLYKGLSYFIEYHTQYM